MLKLHDFCNRARSPVWRVEEVEVIASHLGEGAKGRPRHEVLARLPLGG
ncbi:MAG TPA: hypothetical protein H9805_09825 [Candidatus Janibacter merdipullorum]|nr:hypothetical protein [Candidatus Janibacter merdipullorum]